MATTHRAPREVGRGDRQVKRLVSELKAQWRRAGRVCARCGQRIDYDAPKSAPESCQAGHIKAWSTHPHLRLDPRNFQPEHALCNQEAGNDVELPGMGVTSEAW